MDYPHKFPAYLRPRLDAEILRLRYKFPLAGDSEKRLQETVAAFMDIACKAVENGEWAVHLAHLGLKDFAWELCKDFADLMDCNWWTQQEYDEHRDGMMQRIECSTEWLGHLNRLAKLAEKGPKAPNDESMAVQLNKLCDEARMTVEDVAEAVHIEPRSVYRHLSGEAAPRKRQLDAYEKVFSDKLKRRIRLKTSAKRQ
jgi:hypothetical protein